MARVVDNKETVPTIISASEAYDAFDREVRRLMDGMSGEEFMERWEAGEFAEIADKPGHLHIMRLALLRPRVDY